MSFRPACFRTLFHVPGGMSSPRFPETVTLPRRSGCLS
jgi:hypothetical protein